MQYKAPDGKIIETMPFPQEVVYSCPCFSIPEGIYESEETFGSATETGIKQMKIKRIVSENLMTIIIRESSDQELLDYKSTLITTNQEQNAS